MQGILGSSLERTQEACRNLNVAHAYKSLDDLLQDKTVDVVHICTPNNFHFAQAKAAMEAGSTLSAKSRSPWIQAESAGLVELAKSTSALALSPTIFATTRSARKPMLWCRVERLASLGWLTAAFCRIGCSFLLTGIGGWSRSSAARLRVVADIGTHWLDLITWITNRKVDRALRRLGNGSARPAKAARTRGDLPETQRHRIRRSKN